MSKEKRLIILIIVYIISVLCVMLSQLFKGILGLIFPIVFNIIIAIITVFAMKITKMEIDTNYKNYKQYIIGIDLCALLILLFGIIPLSCGINVVGSREEFSLFAFIYNLFQYIVIIGPVEELLFRFYIQDTIKDFLPNLKWISVIVSSILFGAFHVNFNLMFYIIKACSVSFLGLFFGGVKYYFDKDFGYFGLALCHGLYDFLLYVISLTIA